MLKLPLTHRDMRRLSSVLFIEVVDAEGYHLCQHDAQSNVQVSVALVLGLRRKETNVDELVHDYVENRKRHNTSFDDAYTSELWPVYKGQIVLVDIVFEQEEHHGEYGHIWHNNRENHSDCECCEAIRHMVAKIKGIVVDKRLQAGILFA